MHRWPHSRSGDWIDRGVTADQSTSAISWRTNAPDGRCGRTRARRKSPKAFRKWPSHLWALKRWAIFNVNGGSIPRKRTLPDAGMRSNHRSIASSPRTGGPSARIRESSARNGGLSHRTGERSARTRESARRIASHSARTGRPAHRTGERSARTGEFTHHIRKPAEKSFAEEIRAFGPMEAMCHG